MLPAEPGALAEKGEPVLRLRQISKRFGAVQALDRVDLEVHAGEVVALVGDNGAGKSTLIKIISGVQMPDDGEIEWQRAAVTIRTPHDAAVLGIATVFQDLALCENLDVVANLFLGREVSAPGSGWLDETAMERTARDLLATLSVKIPDVRRAVDTLSGGQRQSVAVARTLLGNPQVILLDEPTAALGVEQTGHVLELIGRLRERGLAVVLVSHNLANVYSIADRAAVLFLGRNNGDFPLPDTPQEDVVGAITGVRLAKAAAGAGAAAVPA